MAGFRETGSARQVPTTADAAYDRLREESEYGQLASASCRRYWWLTGDFEMAIGAWLVVAALIFTSFPVDGVSSVVGWLLLAVSLSVPVIIPIALRNSVVLPLGLAISAPPRMRPSRGLLAAGFALYGAIGVLSVLRHQAFWVAVLVASCAAVVALLAYARSGCTRHFVLAALLQLLIPLTFEGLVPLLGTKGAGAAPVFGLFCLGPTLPFALTMLLVGGVVLAGGIWAFVHAVRERLAAMRDSEEDHRLVVGLAAADPLMRFMTASYLCRHPNPVTVVRLIYGADDDNLAIAATMRLALVSIWGPSAEEQLKRYLSQTSLRGKRAVELTAEEWHLRRDAQARFESEEVERFDAIGAELRRQSGRLDDVVERLEALADTDDQQLFASVVRLMGQTHERRAYEWLVGQLSACDGDRARAQVLVAGFYGAGEGALPCVERCLGDSRTWLVVCAAHACAGVLRFLGRSPGASTASRRCEGELHPWAFALARDAHSLVRASSCELLASYGTEAAPLLTSLAGDRSALVRAYALRALSRADEYTAGGYVFAALGDSRSIVREAAVRCAEELHLTSAMNRVVVLVNDPSEAVSSLANEFILMSQSW